MTTTESDRTAGSRTQVVFDLKEVLTDEQLAAFEAAAAEAGAKDLTEHFLNLTLGAATTPQRAA